MADLTKRYAVVTGANKGIGLEICKQLASQGITVVLTARDEKGDLKLLINSKAALINNAAVAGSVADTDALKASAGTGEAKINWNEIMSQTYDLAVECIQTNYYGAKRTTEALFPLLQLSDSPRIVNNIPSEWAKEILNDAENLTEERIDEVLNVFLKHFKEGSLEAKGFRINCVCPGYVKTDITYNTGVLTVEEGAESPVRLALLPDDGPSGLFFVRKEVSSFEE
ncbi:hypothetical protein DH2020_002227 [Rehmannia glutinosa]|uniref:Short-chain dehydrogenase/reductase n=1 Tax=Rehmannia glutinosa TaxID=99300 RepID=A0ABR0XT94_REHGL